MDCKDVSYVDAANVMHNSVAGSLMNNSIRQIFDAQALDTETELLYLKYFSC
jgi:hypothetical protein